MSTVPEIDAIVFDILGTMVDEPGGIRRAIRTSVPGVDDSGAVELAGVWSGYVAEQQAAMVAGSRPYADSTVLDLEAAERVRGAAGVADPEVTGALAAAAQRLEPWSDSVSGLARLAERRTVVGLSNASHTALTRINAHAGLRWHQVLSAQDARGYKPDPDVYRLAIANLGCDPDRLLMVAAHAWDLRGARAVGMRTAYVERPIGDPPAANDAFDLTATSLDALAQTLESG